MAVEKSGVHLTGADSGWPVGAASEPPYRKNGTGADEAALPQAEAVAGNVVTDDASTNEQQTLTVTGTSGTWKPHANAAAVAFNASASAVQTALEAVFGVGGVTVTGSAGGPYTVTFHAAYGYADEPALSASDVTLAGTGHGVAVAELVKGVA